MFLRAKIRKKDGKQHRYFSVVENRRVGQNRTAQRTVLYLGEINDSQEAIWEVLEADFAVAEKDRLYRCLDRILEHKLALFQHLRERWEDLFQTQFDVLLYDLTSTYIEGEGEEIPKAKYGYSRDQRFDSKQVVIALVITPEGFPLAYEVMDGNTSDRTTLRSFLDKIESSYGRARRVWVMDRGIPTEAVLEEMRRSEREISYLVGTPRSKIRQYEKKWLDLPW